MLGHIIGLLINPVDEWEKIANRSDDELKRSVLGFLFLIMIPPISSYIGITQVGWKILGDGERVRITAESAIAGTVLFYLALVGAAIFIGFMMHWMSSTYGAKTSKYRGVVFIFYCSAPIYLVGFMMAFPLWWRDMLLATATCGYAMRLLYLGVPAMMSVPEERGFLYASAAFAVSMVYVVLVLTATIIAWEYFAMPVFTD